jgi:hypothetical protein
MTGGQTKCNEDRIRIICEARREKLAVGLCAKLAGISRSSLYEWLDRGEQGEEPYATFYKEWQEANREVQGELVGKAADKSPEWLLSRHFPEDFHQARKVEHSGKIGGPDKIQVEVIESREDLEEHDDDEG